MAKEEQEMEEIQIELDEDEIDEGKKDKKLSEPEDDEEESDDLEDSDGSEGDKKSLDDKSESSEDREAIRERRRREKKMKRERERRDRMLKDNIISSLQKEVQQLKEVAGQFSKEFGQVKKKTLDSEKKELSDIYNQASKVMEVAIAEGDGKKFSEAQRIRDGVLAKYNSMENSRVEKEEPEQEARAEVKQAQPDIVGEEGKRYGIAWVKKNSSWYDANGNNRDSKVVQTIDTDLYNEGYDPNTKEYWDELTDRCKEYLPHRFKAQAQKSSPQIVGGSGRESNPASYKNLTVPKEFLQSLKAAGYEQGSEKFKAAVKNYYAQKKGA